MHKSLSEIYVIGRLRSNNEEMKSAPVSAHVKRTVQDVVTLSDGSLGSSLRRSMPWSDGQHPGLMFTSFGKSFEAFEAQLAKMTGATDGITDAPFTMSKPMSGAYFWCPPAGIVSTETPNRLLRNPLAVLLHNALNFPLKQQICTRYFAVRTVAYKHFLHAVWLKQQLAFSAFIHTNTRSAKHHLV